MHAAAPRKAPSGPGPARLPTPDAETLARSERLAGLIRERVAAAGGWVDFARYMQWALYEPGLGYYSGAARKFGAEGDFVTAPEISPLFAQALARQAAQAFGQVPRRVLEFGAGTGSLAEGLLRALAHQGMDVTYQILEVSGELRARQRERLAGLPVTWLDTLPADFEGVVIANEVLDVLPVRLFVQSQAGAIERGVALGGGGLCFAAQDAGPDLAGAVGEIAAEAGALPAGYGSEWCALLAPWLGALAGTLRRGLVLLLDYGFPRAEYYHPQRTMGTLMCHYRQHAHAEPLWLPGANDITAHVDFTACARAARRHGLDVLGYTSQAQFLINCGILDLLPRGAPDPAQTGALMRLLSEAEMGELVKVLALGRGLDLALAGFARGDRRHRLGAPGP